MGRYMGKTEAEWRFEADNHYDRWNLSGGTDMDEWDAYMEAKRYANHAAAASTDSDDTTSSSSSSSGSTTSTNNTSAVAGTSTAISAPADYSSSNVGDVSSNTETTGGGEESIDYSAEPETVVEPSIETRAETETVVEPSIETQAETQELAVAEEIPATPEQPSGQYIYAPEEGGQLWGGNENDTLFGGAGQDIFIGGKEQGSDTFLNVSANDEVRLPDVTLKDISDISKDGDTITISLDNGNVLTIQSTDSVSGAVVLADSTWHFRHTN